MTGGDTSDDALQLAALGHAPELKRTFSPLAMLGLAFAILNSWTALATSLSLALSSGGPTSVLWGLITAGICNLCLAASLAEFLSAYPSAGGQYHWAAMLCPNSRMISWITGWINVGGWMALTATGGLLGSQLILGIISFMDSSFKPKSWQQFLIYIGYNIFAFCLNAFANRIIPHIDRGAIIWSITGFVVVSITVLACASPNYSSASFVFGDFINTTGWPDGLAWLLGLLQGGFGLTGFDAVAHMIEEIPNPRKTGPFVMITCVAIGTFTGFIFLMCLLFVAGDINQVITSGAGPLLQILYNATSSHAGAICLLMFPLVCTVFATIAIMTTSSRMAWAFARDRGLPFSRFFAKVHPGLDVPVNALALTLGLVIIFGCIFLGSSSAFNAITSASVVALSITYAIPIACNVLQGRKGLPADRPFVLPSWFGWFANLLGIAYVTLTSVLFLFPPELPVNANNMNYCVVAFGIWLFISLLTYIFDGRKNYTGPKLEIVDEHVLTASPSPEMTRTNNQMDYSEKGKESGF
ncbi:amino acid transporter, partial [Aureobasidium melanogenum]